MAQRFGEPSLRKTLLKARLVPRWLTSSDFRLAFTSGVSANSVCFERELLDHFRLMFESAHRQFVHTTRASARSNGVTGTY